MNLVTILTDEDGLPHEKAGKWHLVQNFGDSSRTVCSGEVFGYGEGSATYKTKVVKRGGITCENCLRIIKWHKSIKL
jgi:hypothetical protein